MEQLSFFLEKFKTLGLESALVKKAFAEAARKVVGAEVPPEAVDLRSGVIYVRKISPMLRSELFLKRQELKEELQKMFGERKILAVR